MVNWTTMLLGMILSLTAVVLYLMYEILTLKARVSDIEQSLQSDDDDDDENIDIDISNEPESFHDEAEPTQAAPAPVRRRRVAIAEPAAAEPASVVSEPPSA